MAFYKHPLFLVAIGIVLVLAAVPSARTEVSSWFGSDGSPKQNTALAIAGDAQEVTGNANAKCAPLSVATSTTITVGEDYNPTTSVNDACQYRVNGGSVRSCTPGTAFTTAPPGSNIEVLVASNATSSTWYPVVYSPTIQPSLVKSKEALNTDGLSVDCGTVTNNIDLVTGDIGTITTAIYNKDGTENINATSGTQAVGTGASVIVDWNLVGSSEDWFGTEQVLLCAEYNGTAFQKVEINDARGNPLTKADHPKRLTIAAGAYEDCWVDTAFRGAQDRVYKVRMEAISGTDPGSADDVSLTLADDAWFASSQSTKFVKGFQNDADTPADVGAGDTTDTINVT